MIEVTAELVVVAADDTEADEVLKAIARLGSRYPAMPSVRIHEKSRELGPDS